MISLLSVRPSEAETKPGPPGRAVAASGSPKSIAISGRGAGAAWRRDRVSPEKSMDRPPKAGAVGAEGEDGFACASWVAADSGATRTGSPVCCLLIDASLPCLDTPGGYNAGELAVHADLDWMITWRSFLGFWSAISASSVTRPGSFGSIAARVAFDRARLLASDLSTELSSLVPRAYACRNPRKWSPCSRTTEIRRSRTYRHRRRELTHRGAAE